MVDKDAVKKNLEEAFDIPFSAQMSYENREPVFILAPEDPGKEFFSIKVSFRNQIRITMDFIPQKYSVNFIRSMGNRSEEDREVFSSYCMLMKRKGARVVVKVNGIEINVSDVSSWPGEWFAFEAKVTKMPIVEDGVPDYTKATMEWGSLMVGMVLALANIVPVEEEQKQKGYREGDVRRVELSRYERNPLNRKLCLAAKGYDCAVCGFDFEETYGELGHHFIHVHHIIPVSQVGAGHIIDPIKNLIPVCPNCHAMLHRSTPPLHPEQLKAILTARKKTAVYYNFTSQVSMVAESEMPYGNDKNDGKSN